MDRHSGPLLPSPKVRWWWLADSLVHCARNGKLRRSSLSYRSRREFGNQESNTRHCSWSSSPRCGARRSACIPVRISVLSRPIYDVARFVPSTFTLYVILPQGIAILVGQHLRLVEQAVNLDKQRLERVRLKWGVVLVFR